LQGIADGINAHGVAAGTKIDLWDVVALNAAEEWEYYVKEYDKLHGIKATASLGVPEHCSAFVATGSYTKDGKVVIAHNNWTGYLDGERWTIVYDIVPAKGYRMLMDGLPASSTVPTISSRIRPGSSLRKPRSGIFSDTTLRHSRIRACA